MTTVYRNIFSTLGVLFFVLTLALPLSTAATNHCNPGSTDPDCQPGPAQASYSQQPGPAQASYSQQPGPAQASYSASNQLRNPIKFDDIVDLFKAILDILIIFAVPVIVFFLIWSGFLYVTAQGDPGKIQTATKAFTWTIIGGVLILGAWVLVEVIQGTVEAIKRQ